MTTITIPLPRQEKDRLIKIASNFGLSVAELSRRVLEELSNTLPIETIKGYTNPIVLKSSLRHALKDWKDGKISASL